MKRTLLWMTAVAVLLYCPCPFLAQYAPQANPDVAAADQLLQSGRLSEAIAKYQLILKADAKLVPAQAGLVRAYLRNEQVDTAYDLAKSSLAAQPNSASLLAALGRLQYRRGEFAESETSLLAAKKIDPKLADTYLGLAEVYNIAFL